MAIDTAADGGARRGSAPESPVDADTQTAMTAARAITASAPPSPPDITPVCYLTDKLSPENRIRIYQFVFGPGKNAQRMDSRDDHGLPRHSGYQEPCRCENCLIRNPDSQSDGSCKIETHEAQAHDQSISGHSTSDALPDHLQLIHTEIFAVNKLIHGEAIEAFYNNKIVIATFDEFDRLLDLEYPRKLIRDVEIVFDGPGYHSVDYIPQVLRETQTLPRLRYFAINCDNMSSSYSRRQHVTVREFAELHNLGGLVCTGIGKYKLGGKFDKITLGYSMLAHMWPRAASTPEGLMCSKNQGEF